VFLLGVGHDMHDNSPYDGARTNHVDSSHQATFIYTLVYIITLVLFKISQLCLYLLIFRTEKRLCQAINIAIGLVILWGSVFLLNSVFLCDSVGPQWSIVQGNSCRDQVALWTCLVATNFALDLVVTLMPMHRLWKTQMSTSKKITVIAIFALGSGDCIISAVHFAFLFRIDWSANFTGSSKVTFVLITVELAYISLRINLPEVLRACIRLAAPTTRGG
ncbi:uncharacterized protein B0I36DRAFT_229736, partial [Microdochium trichocladiopsis]